MRKILILSAFLIVPLHIIFGQESLIITEFMAINNNTLQDEDSTYSDWIEIFNADTLPINLAEWYLTDDSTDYYKWGFPDMTMDTGEYLVVFASDKDRYAQKDKLHTNFKLSGTGEFLALCNPDSSVFASVFKPAFPEQYNDISYGLQSGTWVYFNTPTPGTANQNSGGLYTPPPVFGTKHGYFFEPFLLNLSGEYANTDIYYTTDASTPDTMNSILYTGPIHIKNSSIIRAVAVSGNTVSNSVSQTYIFPDSVIRQSNDRPGYPNYWIDYYTDTVHGSEVASYAMKQNIINMPEVSNAIIESLESLPVMSIVSDIDNFFSLSTHPDSGGIYMYTGMSLRRADDTFAIGKGWERPASIEYFNPGNTDDPINFQSNCAVKLHGNASADRRKTMKHSFRIGFKAEYGPTKLKTQLFGKGSPKQYDWFVLRGGFDERLGLQLRDPYVKNSMRAMGQYSAYNRFVHVYLNGMYWGMYNLCEYMDENCMRDNLGGDEDDYDVLKDYVQVEAGDTLAWLAMANLMEQVYADPKIYPRLLGKNPDGTPNPEYPKYLDPENLIDYIMVNFFVEMGDWDEKNWVGARRKTDSEGFQFIIWDAEYSLRDIPSKTLANDWRTTSFYYSLIGVTEFRNLIVSRINKHLFEDGALTPKPCIERYAKGLAEIDTALIADQARWVADEDDIWNTSYHAGYDKYFSERTESFFRDYVNGGYYPQIDVPLFNITDLYIPVDSQLYMTAPEGGTIRYTTDGTDPGHYSLETNSAVKVYDNTAIPLPPEGEELTIKARSKVDSLWSVLETRTFIIGDEPVDVLNTPLSANSQLSCYPNPMSGVTSFKFILEETSTVSLNIYNPMGLLVTNLVNDIRVSGEHTITWYADNLPPGVYYGILENHSNSTRDRIIIVRE